MAENYCTKQLIGDEDIFILLLDYLHPIFKVTLKEYNFEIQYGLKNITEICQFRTNVMF